MTASVKVTFVLNLKPGAADTLTADLIEKLPETRKFPGCLSVNAYLDQEGSDRMILIEEWASKADYEKYLAWRKNAGGGIDLPSMLSAPSKPDYWICVA